MKKEYYQHCTIDELAADPNFQRWVMKPTLADTRFWQEVLVEHPHLRPNVNTARQLVQLARAGEQSKHWSAASKQEMHDRIMGSIRQDIIHQTSSRRLQVFAWAASFLIVVISIWFYWPHSDGAGTTTVYRTGFGESRSVQLPDGSQVTLNANSVLSLVDEGDAGGDRIVELDGEAYFEVAPKPATGARFVVVTKDLEVNVLGTVFNVYARERATSVTLEEGMVELKLKNESKKLLTQPGDQVVYSRRDQHLEEKAVTPQTQSSWKDGILIFEEISLEDLAKIIEETFGKEVVFEHDAIRSERLSGTIPGAHDLNLLLETLEVALEKIKITEKEDRIRFEDSR